MSKGAVQQSLPPCEQKQFEDFGDRVRVVGVGCKATLELEGGEKDQYRQVKGLSVCVPSLCLDLSSVRVAVL